MPRWAADGKSIVALATKETGKAVVQIDTESGNSKVLIPASHENIGHPVLRGKLLFYNSNYSGIDNIFVLETESGQRYQVTSSKYGAYNPVLSEDGKTMYYNEQTRDGLDVVSADFSLERCQALQEVRTMGTHYYSALVEQTAHGDLLDNIPQNTYTSKSYSKFLGFFNPHSWGPLFTNSLVEGQVGLFSRDVLSNVSTSLGYNYNFDNRDGNGFARVSYQGFFPILDFEFSKGNRRSDRGQINGQDLEFKWNETGVEAGLRLPLILTNSKFSTQMELGNTVGIRKISGFGSEINGASRLIPINDSLSFFFRDELADGDLYFNRFTFSFFNLLKRSPRDMNGKWGQFLRFEYFNTPYNGDFTGRLMAVRSNLYFPGLFKHHSAYVSLAYQRRDDELSGRQYYFNNRIPKPRGFSYPDHRTFTTIQGNYLFPLWYPDFNLGPVLNIKRIKVNGFMDFGLGRGENFFIERNVENPRIFVGNLNANYLSYGAELLFDVNIMRFRPEFELGLRAVYKDPNRLAQGGFGVEFVLGSIGF